MPDAFANRHRTPFDPAVSIFSITPDDGNDLPQTTIALNVATPGTVRVTMADGSVGAVQVHPGQQLPIRVRRVWFTGTTATGIQGLT